MVSKNSLYKDQSLIPRFEAWCGLAHTNIIKINWKARGEWMGGEALGAVWHRIGFNKCKFLPFCFSLFPSEARVIILSLTISSKAILPGNC